MNRTILCLMLLATMLASAGQTRADWSDDHRRGDARQRDRDHRRELAPEQIDEAMRVLRHVDADEADRLAGLREQHPDRFEPALRQWFPRLELFLAVRRYDPQMYELRVEDFRLAHQSRSVARQLLEARKNDRRQERELQRQLEKLVAEHFDIRQKMRERELTRLEERIERLREQLEDRADERRDLIEQRISELTQQDTHPQW